MKRNGPAFPYCPPGGFTDSEFAVAGILLELPRIIDESVYSFSWGARRRRSAVFTNDRAPSLPPPQQPILKLEAASPATPFSFSSGESDERPTLLKRKQSFNNKSPQDWMQILEEQAHNNKLLLEEKKKLESYMESLKAINVALKTRKHELSSGEAAQLELEARESVNLGTNMGGATSDSAAIMVINNNEDHHHHHQRSQMQMMMMMMMNGAYPNTMSFDHPAASGGLMGRVPDNVGPRVFLDLNTPPPPASESYSYTYLDENARRAHAAAEARQRRRQICKGKNSNYGSSSSRPRLSFRFR